jgi:glucose/arabinose dehydrogenase
VSKAIASRLIFLLILTYILKTTTNAQDTTPTPAPTKTPASEETIQQSTTTEEKTLTQADLSVITGNVQRPNGAVWFNNMLYVICSGDWTIYELEDVTGSTKTYIYGVRNGHSLFAEANENNELTLWVPDFATNQLLLVNPVRSPQIIASDLEGPWGIAKVDDDHFAITSLNSNSIFLVNRSGETEKIAQELRSPTGIAVDNEAIYFANSGSARRAIEWIERSSIPDNVVPQPLVSGLQNTTGLVMGNDNMLYFAYSLGTRGVVGRVDPVECREKGGCSNDEVEIILYTELAAPLAGLTLSPDMKLFIHTMFRPEIYWVQLGV